MNLRLTALQRKELFEGKCPPLRYPGDVECPVEVGFKQALSTHVSVEVTGIRRTRKGEWSLQYTVVDQRLDRDRYMTPSGFHSVPQAEDGKPLPMTPEEELGYTTNPARAMEPGVPSVSLADQDVLDMQARNRFADHRDKERAAEMAKRDLATLNFELSELVKRAAKLGISPTEVLAPVVREVSAQHRGLKEAA